MASHYLSQMVLYQHNFKLPALTQLSTVTG